MMISFKADYNSPTRMRSPQQQQQQHNNDANPFFHGHSNNFLHQRFQSVLPQQLNNNDNNASQAEDDTAKTCTTKSSSLSLRRVSIATTGIRQYCNFSKKYSRLFLPSLVLIVFTYFSMSTRNIALTAEQRQLSLSNRYHYPTPSIHSQTIYDVKKSPSVIDLNNKETKKTTSISIKRINQNKKDDEVNMSSIQTKQASTGTNSGPVGGKLVSTSDRSALATSTTSTKSFLQYARETGTDKVKGLLYLPECLKNDTACTRPSCEREKCRPWGHFYHTMYQQKLEKYTHPKTQPFQLMEIGFNLGFGYDTFTKFFAVVPGAELHTIEISCIEEGPRSEGKWPWGNFAKENKNYDSLLKQNLLHCGDASNVTWLNEVYTQHMNRPNAPPLKIVIDDGSHLANHMVHSMFFWFPRIEPGGILIIEDIQPIDDANLFRTQFLPQIMMDLHFCGDPAQIKDQPCFPTLYPLLQSIHCEMHICVFERNDQPAIPDLSLELSLPPPNALDMKQCYSFAHSFGRSDGG